MYERQSFLYYIVLNFFGEKMEPVTYILVGIAVPLLCIIIRCCINSHYASENQRQVDQITNGLQRHSDQMTVQALHYLDAQQRAQSMRSFEFQESDVSVKISECLGRGGSK